MILNLVYYSHQQQSFLLREMSKKEIDFEMVLGDVINDELQLRLILEGLQNFDQQQAQPQKSSKPTAQTKLTETQNRTNIQQLANREQYNFKQELDIEGGKKYRSFKTYEQEKFKLLGYNQEGKPLFKFSDLFLTSDEKVTAIFKKYFQEVMHGAGGKNAILETGELSKKYEKGYDFNKIVEGWEKKQYEDFTNDKKNKMNQQELEEVVVNRGDSKENYWIYKIGQRKKFDYQDIYNQKFYSKETKPTKDVPSKEYINYNLLNPRFVENMHRAANRIKAQYSQIEEFESDDDKLQIENTEGPDQSEPNQTAKNSGNDGFWGEFADKSGKQVQTVGLVNPVKSALVEEQLREIVVQGKKDDPTKNYVIEEQKKKHCTFVDNIIKEYSVVNYQLLNNSYKGKQTVNQYNRIEYHLENPNFFLTKLHYALQKKSEQFANFLQKGTGKAKSEIGLNRMLSVPGDRSIVSGSNHNTLRASQIDEDGELNQYDDHQSIENKILREMSLQPKKKPINHSQIATKLHYIKFSNDLEHFKNFHRFEFKYDLAFENKTKVQLIRNTKPLKCKGTDFNINIEKKDSYTKFSRPESLSLASGEIKQYIMVEYIEEVPLLMSEVGMCERIILQVNTKEMLQKINRDVIESNQFDVYEDMRDNPDNKPALSSTQQKMELWRKNIKNYFGDNGKVYLWEPKRQSKLIGNPEGLGIALMESNLAATPIVKKTPSKRDFILVREKDRDRERWVIRKIDSLYVSGQVEPKQVVSSPGDRPYQTFLEKYQVAFLTKFATANNYKISIDAVKNYFPNTPQTSAESRIRKMLKQKMDTDTKDNKIYHLKVGDNEEVTYKLEPQEYCLFERMQKSLWDLEEVGIRNMRSMEKMKSILRKYFWKTNDKDLKHFATARMIRDQLQLTSWYLTQSFSKFIDKHARIEMVGHADPTNGHGGYSYIKKPQKERTDKDEAQQRQEKNKLSGTQFDLRKLKSKNSVAILQQLGYTRDQLQKLGRWDLVYILKGQKDTEYARKERENKQLKEQNQRKQRSKALNTLLRNLRNEEEGLIQSYEYGFNPWLDLDYYCDREKANWMAIKEKYDRGVRACQEDGEGEGDGEDDGDDDD